jgi:hypothetical protein
VQRSVEDILSIQNTIEELSDALEDLNREIAKYEPYGDFDPVLAQKLLD